jgi:iron uptake system component EfeO
MTSDRRSDGRTPSRRLQLFGVAGAASLALASGGLFYYAMRSAPQTKPAAAYKIVVREKICDPNHFSVPAGRVTFEIHNASNRILEWEILDGVLVVEERENIAPGFHSRLTAQLKPGTYQITCGLLSNPRGTLTVTPSAESEAERKKPPLKSFVGPLSEFKVYLVLQSSALERQAEQLKDAIQKGDLAEARQSYLAARLSYRRIETVAGRFSDLKNSIDPVADYLEKREADPAFTGFHRIEYGLFSKDSVDGLEPMAAKLLGDVTALKTRLRELKLAPEELAQGTERQSRLLAQGGVAKGESRYALNDLAEFQAALEGMEKGVLLLAPLADGAAPDVSQSIREKISAPKGMLDGLKGADGYPSYDQVDIQTKTRLAKNFSDLADSVARLNEVLGLE